MRWNAQAKILRSALKLDSPYLWATLLRLALVLLMKPHIRGDAADFQIIAHNLAGGHGFSRCWLAPFPPTTQRPPLYPFILSFLYIFEISEVYGPAFLNWVFDLLSMRISRRFAEAARLPKPGVFPWVIALCPLLLTMGENALTENLSVLLFFLATLAYFGNRFRLSGFCYGLLALCRSYYLIFPILLSVFRPIKTHSGKILIVLCLMGFAAPAVWVSRNLITLHSPVFSQTGTAGQQAYVGLCRFNFDWWDQDDVQHLSNLSPFPELMNSNCKTDSEVLALNRQAWARVGECVKERPTSVVVNILGKAWSLFFEWGQIFPYDYVEKPIRILIDVLMMLIWARMISIWVAYWRNSSTPWEKNPVAPVFRYAALNILYIAAITLPFGIDARYLLAPGILAFALTLQIIPEPIDFVRAPLMRIFGSSEE